MSVLQNAAEAWDMAAGRVPWRGPDLLVVTARTPEIRDRNVAWLRDILPAAPRILGVIDAEGRGNLVGTLRAWEAAREIGGRVTILHDGGQASRTGSLAVEAGSRGGLVVGGAPERPLRLLQAVAVLSAPLAATSPGADVIWGSQVVVPEVPWAQLRVPPQTFVKFARERAGPPEEGAAGSVGLLAWDADGRVREFASLADLGSEEVYRTWLDTRTGGDDLGSFRTTPEALDGLLGALRAGSLPPGDLDPGLLRPLIAGRLPEFAALSVGACRVGSGALWRRFRHPDEIRTHLMEAEKPEGFLLRASLRAGLPP